MSILVDENTRVVIQGITGREATTMSKEMIAYGTKVVAGVTPGKEGEVIHGIPVFDCVADAVRQCDANASVISVPPAFAKDAAFEAIDAGIKFLLVLSERVPIHDVIQMVSFAKRKNARIVGPNSGGIISPGKTRLGYLGGNNPWGAFTTGPIGVVSRSGGMSVEISNLLTTHGLGQSTVISMGGDPVTGSIYADFLELFEKDPETKAVVFFCEPGGSREEHAARYIREQFTKPVVVFFGGRFVDQMPGVRFGHASVIVGAGFGTTSEKARIFKEAGVGIVDSYSDIVGELKKRLG
ncbi:MAG: succinate--CoA ligase subunit alpha [Actinobacteria bacterium]|nr:succinate--CoA ligase subunit alpha [Actinomycetota bacterium]